MCRPLSGVVAGRVSDFRLLDLELDYGVDIGLTMDVYQKWGKDSVAEVHLGRLAHRRRSGGFKMRCNTCRWCGTGAIEEWVNQSCRGSSFLAFEGG